MEILNLMPRMWLKVAQRVLLTLMLVAAVPAWSADWDAKTRLTNTVLNDQDVKMALERGLNEQFTKTFPSNRFGIYVLVDKSNAAEPTRGVVYVLLGLCKRNADGSFDLPEGTYSSMLILANEDPNNERQQLTNRLAEQAAIFAKAAIQNAARIH